MDLNQRIVAIDQAFSRGVLTTPKTKASFGSTYLLEPLVTILLWHRQHSVFTDGDDFVFCREDGGAAQGQPPIISPLLDNLTIGGVF